jgi:glycosyltransferase involved in cell wall biosynthesis
MTKKSGKKEKKEKNNETKIEELPFISVVTVTFNRRPFIPIMLEIFKNYTYPKDRMEWIIVDDGTDPIKDLIEASGISQIKYFYVDKKMTLGAKRNYSHSLCSGSFIIYQDDDDWYPAERISHSVEILRQNPQALCAGASEIYIYFKHIQQMYQAGPYGPNHSTAGTFAFRRELLNITKYNETASLAEEKEFLKNYTIPFVQLNPIKTILVFSHNHNTFDKKKLLDQPPNDYFKKSNKTVNDFIFGFNAQYFKNFFLNEIDKLLANYEPGEANNKPDVIIQLKQIEEERKKQFEQLQRQGQNGGTIMMKQPNGQDKEISPQEVVKIITQQQEYINALQKRVAESNDIIQNLQNIISQKSSNSTLQENNYINFQTDKNTNMFNGGSIPSYKSKSEPEINILL